MRPKYRLLLVASLLGCMPRAAAAQTATQVVRIQVNAISQIGLTGAPSPLVIDAASPGEAPASVTADGAAYAITTNEANQKITAAIDELLPAGISLEVRLAAPVGAASVGSVPLTTSPADLVTGISRTAASALPITYRLRASATAQLGPAVRTVTFTVVSGT
jgi:hypothetical protein